MRNRFRIATSSDLRGCECDFEFDGGDEFGYGCCGPECDELTGCTDHHGGRNKYGLGLGEFGVGGCGSCGCELGFVKTRTSRKKKIREGYFVYLYIIFHTRYPYTQNTSFSGSFFKPILSNHTPCTKSRFGLPFPSFPSMASFQNFISYSFLF